MQIDMFGSNKPPTIVSYGAGVDSTAMIIEMVALGETIDLVTFADTGSEKRKTISYMLMFKAWCEARGIRFEIVRYQPKNFKNFPPYATLIENCLTNATLPSIAFGFSSCSLKWKVAPQQAFDRTWEELFPVTASHRTQAQPPHRTAHAAMPLSIFDPMVGLQCGTHHTARDPHAPIR